MLDENKYQMPRIHRILNNDKFNYYMDAIARLEKDRLFCGHDMDHLLSVARMMYIINLEEGLDLDKELIYSVALIHDLGRVDEYEKGIDHHTASSNIAEDLMKDADFSDEEIKMAQYAIKNHRTNRQGELICESDEETLPLGGGMDMTDRTISLSNLLRYVDKKSRLCYLCDARNMCKWNEEKKNKKLFL